MIISVSSDVINNVIVAENPYWCEMGDNFDDIKISFGMIVLNGEPFVKYNLLSVYPVAHQIIVVEGACKSSASVARQDGHSTDGTLELLYRFQRESDPENKVIVVTAQDEGYADGFWPEKDEMSRGYANRATGDYLWQIDSDEFYHEEQLGRIIEILRTKRPDMVSFPMITFWGSPEYIVNGFYFIRDRHDDIPRIFTWAPGYFYATHRPATVLDCQGVDLRKKCWFRASQLRRMKIYMYHYSLIFPHQIFSKVRYYKQALNPHIDIWEEAVYLNLKKPFRAHNVQQHLSWIERFKGATPAAIDTMMHDIKHQNTDIEQRDCGDVEKLLSNPYYRIATMCLKACATIMAAHPVYFFYRIYASMKWRIAHLPEKQTIKSPRKIAVAVLKLMRDYVFRFIRRDKISCAKIRRRDDLIHLGSKYGGWVVPVGLLDSESVCYCGGCGEDISFDLELIKIFHCNVYAFDPAPRAVSYVNTIINDIPLYHFFDVGLWDCQDQLKFYATRNNDCASHSLLSIQRTEKYIKVDVKRLSQIMHENNHQKIDLLKIDIEGAEYKVIGSILEDRLDIKILCVEFDEFINPLNSEYMSRIRSSIKSLLMNRYQLVYSQENGKYTFVRNV